MRNLWEKRGIVARVLWDNKWFLLRLVSTCVVLSPLLVIDFLLSALVWVARKLDDSWQAFYDYIEMDRRVRQFIGEPVPPAKK